MSSPNRSLRMSANRRYWRMMFWGLIGLWLAAGLYEISLATSFINITMTKFVASLAMSVLIPMACIAMLTAAIVLVVNRDFQRPLLFSASLISMALLCMWLLLGHIADLPLERSGSQFTYGVIKAFYSTSGVLGSPRVVVIPVSLLGPQTLAALLPLVALYRRFFYYPVMPSQH